jgi:hypothetical protein
VSELELAKDKKQQGGRANAIFWILLLNFGLYIADHLLQVLLQSLGYLNLHNSK